MQEYIRKGYDILEDMYSTKTAATNLAHELVAKKPKAFLEKFMVGDATPPPPPPGGRDAVRDGRVLFHARRRRPQGPHVPHAPARQ